ncbi:MAG TPA: hypothetical protein PKE35_00645 [Anaerolineales bacterium]|nr:hypothetical protein [Anaerolineales bacterium]HMX18194.1 hypothetical protein [Anaerolineales bacterium]HMX72725.1 hypothetical protein [Anaerolineales bacterium]HMZ42666.1 hypothetical protein [Anaerolineales bacterium]HNA54213.1 hypothetical protein [Anaerolineales bacterium]
MKKLTLLLLAVLFLTACAPKAAEMPKAELPAGKAWADGKEIYFIHTEASDAGVAEKLTNMMKSPVVLVPSLANVPAESLANVYVFTNGLAGTGPFGFQADVFDNPPGTDGYTPLRSLHLITWTDETKARELTSAADVLAAEAAGELTIEQPGVVINMPFVVWDGGKR